MVLPSTDDLIFRRTVFVVFAVVPGRCRRAKTVRGHRERERLFFVTSERFLLLCAEKIIVCACACACVRARDIVRAPGTFFSRVRFKMPRFPGKKKAPLFVLARDTTQIGAINDDDDDYRDANESCACFSTATTTTTNLRRKKQDCSSLLL